MKVCKAPNCYQNALTNGYCNKHQYLYQNDLKELHERERQYNDNRLNDSYNHAKVKWYNRKGWKNLSNQIRTNHPYCSKCYQETGVRESKDRLYVDHIKEVDSIVLNYIKTNNLTPVSLSDWDNIFSQSELGKALTDESNLQVLCAKHHMMKHTQQGTYNHEHHERLYKRLYR